MRKLNWVYRSLYVVSAGGLLAAALAGCNVGPKYKRPSYPSPPAYRGADNTPLTSTSGDSLGDEQWASVFHEPELQTLIRTALTSNYDIQIAAQRVAEQRAQIQITRSQEFPTLSLGGTGVGASFNPASLGSGSGTNSISSPETFGSFNLAAAWTPDFWGLYRKQTQSARAQLLAQVWAQRAVRLSLVQSVATTYLALRALDRQLEISKQTLTSRQDSVKLTRTLADGGAAPLSDLREAEALLYAATSQIPQLEQQIQQQENAMSLLLGRNPGPVTHAGSNALTPPPQDLPTGLPTQLLERRPDIQQAEATLVAANAQIGIARAQFFPQLSISASGGIGGESLSSIFSPDGKTIYGLGSLVQPLFEGGKLRGQLNIASETQKEDVLAYQRVIAIALHDVSNALIALHKQRTYREQQEKLVAATQDATRLARLRYQGGSTAYLEVLTTDTNLFNAQLSLVSSQQAEAVTLVQLYSALGGGWQ